jgi:sugar lactone lactonase YvrE
MAGHRFSIQSTRRSFMRILAPLAAGVALLALPPQATASTPPAVSLGASPFSVTPVAVNSLGVSFITLTNTGGSALTGISYSVSAISGTPFSLDGYGPAQGQTAGTCLGVTTLAAGNSCTIQVDFLPKLPGLVGTTLTVSDNAANSPQTVTILGTGVLGQLQFYPAWLSPFAGVIGLGNGCHDTGNGGPAISATLCTPSDVAADPYGNTYILDTGKNVVRKVDASGNITDFAGYASTFDATNPAACGDETDSSGNGCPALDATLSDPVAIAVDAQGSLYISDYGNYCIRKVNAVTGIITKFYSSGPGVEAFLTPGGLAFDPSGNLYVATDNENVVVKITPSGGGSVFAGLPNTGSGENHGYNGDNILATAAELNAPTTVASDLSGNIYIADLNNYRIRMVSAATGKISTIVGDGTQGDTGDGGPAIDAEINAGGVAVDAAGEVYIPGNEVVLVRKVDLSGNITTIAGGGTGSTVPGQATGFGFTSSINYIGLDLYGDLLIPSGSGVVSAGPQGALVFGSQNLNTTSTALSVTLINTGTVPVYFYDPNQALAVPGAPGRDAARANGATADGSLIGGIVSAITGDFAVASGGTCNLTTSGSIAAGATCTVDVTFAPTQTGSRTGTLTFAVEDANNELSAKIVQLSGTGISTLIAQVINFTPPTTPVTYSSGLTIPLSATGGASGNSIVFTIDNTSTGSGSITGTSLNVTGVGTFVIDANQAGNSTYAAATQVQQSVVVNAPAAPAVSISPSSYVFPATTAQSGYQSGNGNPAITLTNIGNAPLTFTGSTPFTIINGGTSSPISVYPNGSCTETYVNFSTSMPANDNCTITVQFWPQSAGAFQATLSVADNASNSPQTVLLSGIGKAGQLQFAPALLTFIAGSYGNAGTPTSGNNANASLIQAGRGIATDTLGNVYFSDTTNNTVWEVTKTTGKISTFAGAPGVGSYSGDGHAAASAGLNSPMQMAFDGAGNLYIADRLNNVVRMINSSGNISTFAGQQGVGSYSGDGGPATSAKLSGPQGVAVDALGNVYIADTGNNIVRKVDTTGNITLFAGTPDHSGVTVAGAATSVLLGSPYQLATDLAGNVFIADFGNSVVSVVNPTGNISIYAGGGSSAVTTTPQPATSASFFVADGVATDPAGDLYIADQHKIYRVDTSQNITLVAGGGTYTNNGQPATSTAVGATAVAVDPSGNLFAQDTNGYVVYEVGPQGALVFGSQAENTTSAVQTVTLINTGNATAYFYNPNQSSAVPGAPSRAAATAGASSGAAHPESGTGSGSSVYSVTGDFAIASGGTCDFSSIAAGASCTINVTFSPTQTGTRTGNITLYADGPYTIPAVINLSGTGTGAALTAQTINFTQPATPVTYASGLTIPLVATGGASGNSVTFSIDGSSTGAGSINGSTLNVTGVGTFVIDANQAGNSTYSAATQVQKSVVVTQAAQAINFTPPATPVTYSSGLTISLSATGGASGNSIVFTIDTSSTGTGSITGSTLTVTGVGTFVIDANQAGNSNYAAATQVQKSVVVTQAAQAINFTQPTTPVTYSSGLTIPLVATGGASGNSIVFTIDTSSTGTGSITGGSTLNVTGVGTFVINANQAGNSNYAAATQVQKSIVVNAPPLPTFNVTSPTPPQTVQPGGAAIYTINVNPVNGSYTGAVTLSASGLPTGATAGFSPNPVTPGSAGAPSTMTIQTAALTASAKSSSWPLAAPVLSLIGLFFVPGKRRRRWLTLAVLLIASLGALTALSACGGGFQLPSHESPPLTITVNGANASGAIVSSTTVQLTVQ